MDHDISDCTPSGIKTTIARNQGSIRPFPPIGIQQQEENRLMAPPGCVQSSKPTYLFQDAVVLSLEMFRHDYVSISVGYHKKGYPDQSDKKSQKAK
jgi:hypothetical protein